MSLSSQIDRMRDDIPTLEQAIGVAEAAGLTIDIMSHLTEEEYVILNQCYRRYCRTASSQMANVHKTIARAIPEVGFQLAILVRKDRDRLARFRNVRWFKQPETA